MWMNLDQGPVSHVPQDWGVRGPEPPRSKRPPILSRTRQRRSISRSTVRVGCWLCSMTTVVPSRVGHQVEAVGRLQDHLHAVAEAARPVGVAEFQRRLRERGDVDAAAVVDDPHLHSYRMPFV